MNKHMFTTVLFAVSVLSLTNSCKKDDDYVAPTGDEPIIIENALPLPADFDWNNIPPAYANQPWEISYDFDLQGENIVLPPNVILYFTTGSLHNGTITGNQTELVSRTRYQIFDALDLAGSFVKEQYLKPVWYGAALDGITDDRAAFVETLAQAHQITAKVLVEKTMFLDVEELGTKSIFLEDNTWIEGQYNAQVIINNLLSPAFYMALAKDITVKNITFLYDNTYDAGYDWSLTTDNDKNQQQLEYYLKTKRGIIFNSTNPVFKGSSSFHTVFSLEGSSNIFFNNVNFTAKGTTANTFMQFVIKFKEQYSENQTINKEGVGLTAIPTNITFNQITFDGTLMGVQGNVNGFFVNDMKSYRYSDIQNADGTNLGGLVGSDTYRFPPPHLFYLNMDLSFNGHYPQNIKLTNVIDYGKYVGTAKTRGASGYCHSLKLIDKVENVYVDNYQSYRRDGLGDWGNINNGVFKNIYAENTSDIFNPNLRFNSLRFLGPLENTLLENVTLKDNAMIAQIYPLNFAEGNKVTYRNVNVYVKELNTESDGPFGIRGSHNTIIKSSLHIDKHTTNTTYKSVIFHNPETLLKGSNNQYEITVEGWRDIQNDPLGNSIRLLFANSKNGNSNYAKVIDASNNMVIAQNNKIQVNTWIRKEVVDLGKGTNKKLGINIPVGFKVKSINANTLENLAAGVEITIGTSTSKSSNLMSVVSKTTGLVNKFINEAKAETGNRDIYLFSNTDFQNRGRIEISLELVREIQYD